MLQPERYLSVELLTSRNPYSNSQKLYLATWTRRCYRCQQRDRWASEANESALVEGGSFSPSARVSYRELPGSSAAVLMAFDLHQQIPSFSPASVAAFLRETVISLPTVDDQQERPIRVFEDVRAAESLAGLRRAAAHLVAAPVGRGPVLAFIGHRDSKPAVDELTFRDLVGVAPDTPLTLSAWAVWIFRELQAARATSEGSGARRRVRGG